MIAQRLRHFVANVPTARGHDHSGGISLEVCYVFRKVSVNHQLTAHQSVIRYHSMGDLA